MRCRQTIFRTLVRVTITATLTLGVMAAAWGLDPGSDFASTAPSAQHDARPAIRLGEQPSRARAIGALERFRLFTFVDSQRGVATVTLDRRALPQLSNSQRRFVVEAFPLQRYEHIDLELQSFRVTGEHTRFVLGRRDGPDVPLAFDPSGITLLGGTVVDYPGSKVFLALSETLITGKIDLGPGRDTYRLSSRAGQDPAANVGRVAVFRATGPGADVDVPLCGIDLAGLNALGPPEAPRDQPSNSIALSGLTPTKGMRTIELAIETDYEYFELFGETGAAAAYVTALVGAISDIYMRETNHRYELTFVRIWDTPNDLYNDPDGVAAFNAFVAYWQSNMGAVQRDAAQYLSGRRDLPFGGIAYLGVVCSNYAYSMAGYLLGFFPDPETPSVYHYDIEVSAHELGHNCGSPHTDAYSPPIDQCYPPPGVPQRGTIMSYCSQAVSGGNAVHEMRFHARVQAQMKSFLSGLSCVIDDCNMNDVDDAADIAAGTSPDVNGNGIPDECEDCDSNGILDPDDISGGAPDVNGNGIPDACEPDCNSNGVPDEGDILLGTSTDAYGNNVPDECEADCNRNSISDFTEIQGDLTLDINRDTILDACEDCDNDGTTDAEALAGAHNAWIASDLLDVVGEYHADTGVLVKNAASGHLADPQDVAITPSGRILVSSALDDRVVEFDRSGAYIGDLVGAGGGGLAYPTGLLLLPSGNLLVSSRDTNSVIEYDGDTGAPVGTLVSPGAGGLLAPFGLALGPNGNLFVTSGDNQVMEYDLQTGAFVGVLVTSADNGGLLDARGMAFKPDGNLLVAGYSSDAVHEYDGVTGAYLRVFHNGGTVYGPWGVRVGPNGNVFVTRDYEIGTASRDEPGGPEPLHATTTRIYEYEPVSGNHLRSYVLGDDTGLSSPTGFAFMPGSAVDCNVNFVPDACDIASGTSRDSNSNGIPDECEATLILSGRSCRSHGASDFCLDLGPGDGQATELRVGGVKRLELDLSTPLDAASVTPGHVQIDCGTHGYGGTILAWPLSDTTITIDLQPGLLDLECCEVRLDGMVSQVGLPIVNVYRVATLMGDANRDGAVTSADAASVSQRVGMIVDSSNFAYDLNADGWITSADYASVSQRLGNVVPSCP